MLRNIQSYDFGHKKVKIGEEITYLPLDSFQPKTAIITHIISIKDDNICKSLFCMSNGDTLTTWRMSSALDRMEYELQTQN